jgi:hypothetical protein
MWRRSYRLCAWYTADLFMGKAPASQTGGRIGLRLRSVVRESGGWRGPALIYAHNAHAPRRARPLRPLLGIRRDGPGGAVREIAPGPGWRSPVPGRGASRSRGASRPDHRWRTPPRGLLLRRDPTVRDVQHSSGHLRSPRWTIRRATSISTEATRSRSAPWDSSATCPAGRDFHRV